MARRGRSGVERIGRYELVERLGVGGMAEVFKARTRGPSGLEYDFGEVDGALFLVLEFVDGPASAAGFSANIPDDSGRARCPPLVSRTSGKAGKRYRLVASATRDSRG